MDPCEVGVSRSARQAPDFSAIPGTLLCAPVRDGGSLSPGLQGVRLVPTFSAIFPFSICCWDLLLEDRPDCLRRSIWDVRNSPLSTQLEKAHFVPMFRRSSRKFSVSKGVSCPVAFKSCVGTLCHWWSRHKQYLSYLWKKEFFFFGKYDPDKTLAGRKMAFF